MAAPIKTGVDYFPHETKANKSLRYIIAKHGLQGYGMYFALLSSIYDESYYSKWGDKETIFFCSENKIEHNKFKEILEDLFSENLFDGSLYHKYKILTSHGIQKRYLTICERRTILNLVKEYVLLSSEDLESYKNISLIGVNSNGKKESKEFHPKKSKETSGYKNASEIGI